MVELVSKSNRRLWSINALSEELDLDRRTIKKYLVDIPPDGEIRGNPAWHLISCIHLLVKPKELASQSSIDPDLMSPEDRKHHYDAELKRFSLEEKLGTYVHMEVFRERAAEIIKATVGALDRVADALEREARIPPEQVDLVIKITDTVRQDMADEVKALAQGDTG